MTVPMRLMSAGNGYRYFLESVVAGDGDRSVSTPLTRYYTEAGCPPSWWTGAGVKSLGGVIAEGDEVKEAQLQPLIGMGRHPVTGDPLGRPYRQFASQSERSDRRVQALGQVPSGGGIGKPLPDDTRNSPASRI